jgi:hypothetical protein
MPGTNATGTSGGRNFAAPVDDHDLPMPLDYFVWAIHREGHPPVIVDTGFGEGRRRGARADHHPAGDRRPARCGDRPPLWSRT